MIPSTTRQPASRRDETLARYDLLAKRVSALRQESIKRSMARPLRLEMMRTAFLVGCILLDIVAIPEVLAQISARSWLLPSLLVLLPLAYFEYRIHDHFFIVAPSD